MSHYSYKRNQYIVLVDMPGELLSQFYKSYFEQVQPEIKQEQKIIEDVVFKNPFEKAEELFNNITTQEIV